MAGATRHYGLDWLRIGAFALLILYHVGMAFVPWDWHVKANAAPVEWAAYPMLLTNPWRIPLLFVVSGYASRMLLAKLGGAGAFARSRTARLLVPLLFGMAVIVAPQPWVEMSYKHGYTADFSHFWLHDYFTFRQVGDAAMPTWNHLWFVAYLWVYSLLLALTVALLPAGTRAAIARGTERALAGWRLIVLPIAWILLLRFVLIPGRSETHGLVDDLPGHLVFLPCFLFGFALGGARSWVSTLVRWWQPALAAALIGYAVTVATEWQWPGDAVPTPGWLAANRVARAVQFWGWIVALLGIAERYWNRDHPWRATLAEAVFPFYIIHQTAIVLMVWWLRPASLAGGVEFLILVAGTAAACALFYWGGRAIGPLRPLIGLQRRRA